MPICRGLRLLGLSLLLLAPIAESHEYQERADPSVKLPCPECGVIYEIREVRRERSPAQSQSQRTAPVGPIIRFSPGDRADPGPHIDVFGSRSMREQLIDRYYEVIVRFDDGRWSRIEVSDSTGLKAGDRIHVHQNRIEPADSP